MNITKKRINSRTLTIPTTSYLISPAMYGEQGSRRISIILKNTSKSNEVITLGISQNATLGIGLVLNAGETISFSQDGGYLPPQEIITAVGSAGTSTLAVYEEIEDVF